MKFACMPGYWQETVDDLVAAGHEFVELSDDPDMLVYRGSSVDFPEDLPESVKVVQVAFAGMDALARDGVLAAHDVRWANAAGIYDDTVAESALALLLAVLHDHRRVKRSWNQRELFGTTDFLFDDKTVAVLGAGGIGKKFIQFIEPFGAEVIAVNRSGNPVEGAAKTVRMDDADAQGVWEAADIFVLIAPLTEQTRHMVNAETLAKMKPNAVVVNVGRGQLIDTEALTQALVDGAVAGAGLDVTNPEPLPADHPLWEMENVVITPHTANVGRFMGRRVGKLALENWELYQAGEKMRTEVDISAGY